ncbi:beta-glucosidase 6 [Salvia hispanica]|uniref:beta-glucosidase 6 n=1 Tax=Salvia hispanica TaxID=49212 RepID=UPI00200996A2|nr:beta-glucosidase 6 [Salvia hispanica]
MKKLGMNCLIFVIALAAVGIPACFGQNISRASFPKGFVFGTASSAFQYEGAVKEDGRGQTIWDKFSHEFGKVIDFSNADVADDQYHRYDEDIHRMKDLGMDAYRFSIAWSRIYPNGSGEINQAGIDHYHNFIDALLAQGIQPYVTLFHWDLPQQLQDKYKGFLNPQIIKDYTAYAETCFKEYGDKVKNWITLNEPHTFAVQGYDVGLLAPGQCSILLHAFCRVGNSATEPYIVGHNLLLAHASAVDAYKKKYQPKQKGRIGISLDTFWFEPASSSQDDIQATRNAIDFSLGWFLEPLIKGDYPSSMRSRVRERLPRFSKEQSTMLRGAYDFIGINHYTTWYAKKNTTNIIGVLLNDSLADSGAITFPIALGKPMYERANSVWLYIVPDGIRSLMNHIRKEYGNPTVIITENGMDDGNNPFTSVKEALKDVKRIKYHQGYLTSLNEAIKDGCNVKGYFVWSMLDNWEWGAGYTSRFGLYYVDYKHNNQRYPKDSVAWFNNFLKT